MTGLPAPLVHNMPDSSLLTDAEVMALQDVFGVGQWLEWRRTPKGSANDSFFLTATTGRYVLRRSNTRKSAAAAQQEIQFIRYLRAAGYPAPEIVPTQQQHGFVEHDSRIYLMTALIPGGSYDGDNPRHLHETAYGLARYHQLARAYAGSFGTHAPSQLQNLLGSGVDTTGAITLLSMSFLSADERKQLDYVLTYIRDQLASVGQELNKVYPRLPKLLVQGSFGRSAMIFEGDRLVGVVDYDRCTIDIRALDLAYTIKALCRVQDASHQTFRIGYDFDRCHNFMVAYQQIEPLLDDELEALPLVFRAQRLFKVVNKCNNLLRKHAHVPQTAKDMRKLLGLIEEEVIRLHWLSLHSRDLIAAFHA